MPASATTTYKGNTTETAATKPPAKIVEIKNAVPVPKTIAETLRNAIDASLDIADPVAGLNMLRGVLLAQIPRANNEDKLKSLQRKLSDIEVEEARLKSLAKANKEEREVTIGQIRAIKTGEPLDLVAQAERNAAFFASRDRLQSTDPELAAIVLSSSVKAAVAAGANKLPLEKVGRAIGFLTMSLFASDFVSREVYDWMNTRRQELTKKASPEELFRAFSAYLSEKSPKALALATSPDFGAVLAEIQTDAELDKIVAEALSFAADYSEFVPEGRWDKIEKFQRERAGGYSLTGADGQPNDEDDSLDNDEQEDDEE